MLRGVRINGETNVAPTLMAGCEAATDCAICPPVLVLLWNVMSLPALSASSKPLAGGSFTYFLINALTCAVPFIPAFLAAI